MPRNGDVVRAKLKAAALRLYQDQGYDQTTAAQIAAAAGVTERTFFRHFPDKREVLFDGEVGYRDALVGAIAAAPAGLAPLAVMREAFRAVEAWGETLRPDAEARQAVIARTPALKERELAKSAALVAALTEALAARGLAPGLAALAVQAALAAVAYASGTWQAEPGSRLGPHLDAGFAALAGLAASS